MFPAHKESPVDPLSKSRHPVMLPVQIMGWVSIFCQSPIIRLCCQCKSWVGSIFCQSPIIRLCCQCKSWGGFQYFVKVPSSGYVASASHGWVQYFVKVPSSGYVARANHECVGFNICQSPFIRLCSATIGRGLSIFVPTSRLRPVNVPSEGRSGCLAV
jgi:hypothetical protein